MIGIVIIVIGLISGGYWYWRTQTIGSLQTITLDQLGIDSFDDVCTMGENSELSCTGNIEQFGCEKYRILEVNSQDLQPHYPMLVCENVQVIGSADAEEVTRGVYAIQGSGLMLGKVTVVKYIIIRDNAFQLIESSKQFKDLFQPIENKEEAAAYFQTLHQAKLVLNESVLDQLKSSFHGEYLIPLDALTLSSVSETDGGFTITAYSDNTLSCETELYMYTFFLTRYGDVIEQNRTLIWQSDLECTS